MLSSTTIENMSSMVKTLKKCSYTPCKTQIPENGPHARCEACRTKEAARKKRKRAEMNKENAASDVSSSPQEPPTSVLSTRSPLGAAAVNVELADSSFSDPSGINNDKIKRPKVSPASSLVRKEDCWLIWLLRRWQRLSTLKPRQ
jgi:hypothetical protein